MGPKIQRKTYKLKVTQPFHLQDGTTEIELRVRLKNEKKQFLYQEQALDPLHLCQHNTVRITLSLE